MAYDNLNLFDVAGRFDLDENRPEMFIHNGFTFAGSGSTLAAATNVGYQSIGVERDAVYVEVAKRAIPKLATYANGTPLSWG